MSVLRAIGAWLIDRFGLQPAIDGLRAHKVPPELTTWRGWAYVLGSSTLAVLLVQIGTGIGLTTSYVPSTAHAHDSLVALTDRTTFGGVLRAMHFFGASAMVVLVLLHMARVFLTGSYKFPREGSWTSGVFLLVLTLLMAWSGQTLRWNQDGLWTVMVHARMAERVPLVGEWLSRFVLGGDTVGGATLSRVFAFHVLVFPALILGLVGLHLYLLLHNGISELPRAGRPVDPATYRQWYADMKARVGRPYWPDTIWREVVAAAVVVGVVVVLAVVFGPRPPGEPPDPTRLHADPRPDWFTLWYYALLWYKPWGSETLFMFWLPLFGVLALLALPLVFPGGERAPSRRPWAVGGVVLAAVSLVVLVEAGARAPWVPRFDTPPFTPAELDVSPGAPAAVGAAVFAQRGCQYCHRVRDRGGRYGPDLTRVASRMSDEEITARILRGVRDMPAYRDLLDAGELDALIAFLHHVDDR